MNGIVFRDTLPYSRTFFEKVPVRFVNLDELVKGALEDRAFVGDAYWEIDAEEPLAYLILRNGRPYRIIGYSGPSITAFINWMRRDNRELTLTYRFVERGALPLLVRCWTEQPVLQDLDNGCGDVMAVLRNLRKITESGLLRVRSGGVSTLIPVEEGKLTAAFGAGGVLKGKLILTFLSDQLEPGSVADFYPGPTPDLPLVGISEAQLVVQSFNAWLDAAKPTWPECARIASTVFSVLKEKEPGLVALSFNIEDGLFLETLPVNTESVPEAFAKMIRSLAKKHPSPENCLRLFGSVNRERKLALAAAGLASVLEPASSNTAG
jgi:hypothetical protein